MVEYQVNGATTWSTTYPPVEGSDSVVVRQRDVAGNPARPRPRSPSLWTPPPRPPTIVGLTNDTGGDHTDKLTNDPTLSMTGVEANAVLEYRFSYDGGMTWFGLGFEPDATARRERHRRGPSAGRGRQYQPSFGAV